MATILVRTIITMKLILAIGINAYTQSSTFTYQYDATAGKSGKFIFKDPQDSLSFEAPASAGYLGAANNPYFQLTKDKGPLPNGLWEIYAVKNQSKAILRLRPTSDVIMPKKTDGTPYRDGFLIHGVDTGETPEQSSTGCIILDPGSRKKLLKAFNKYGVIKLKVTNIVSGDVGFMGEF